LVYSTEKDATSDGFPETEIFYGTAAKRATGWKSSKRFSFDFEASRQGEFVPTPLG
jgi:hypothetical protein